MYSSYLVVRRDFDVRRGAEGLRGVRAAFNDSMSLSGYFIMLHWLALAGRTADFFSSWCATVSHRTLCIVWCACSV